MLTYWAVELAELAERKRPPMTRNDELFARARAAIPGGVNSPVRAFGSVGGTPLFLVSASGAYVTDVDGRDYVDLVGSWGPAILGHAHPDVVEAVQDAAAPRALLRRLHPGRDRTGRARARAGSVPSRSSGSSRPAPRRR